MDKAAKRGAVVAFSTIISGLGSVAGVVVAIMLAADWSRKPISRMGRRRERVS